MKKRINIDTKQNSRNIIISNPVDITATKWGAVILCNNDGNEWILRRKLPERSRSSIYTIKKGHGYEVIADGAHIITFPNDSMKLVDQNGEEWIIVKSN